MNVTQYLMMTVTPLSAIKIERAYCAGDENRRLISEKRAKQMEARYRKAMKGKTLSSSQVGDIVGVSRPLTGLRKLEARGKVRLVRMSSDSRGRKQCIWEWIENPTLPACASTPQAPEPPAHGC